MRKTKFIFLLVFITTALSLHLSAQTIPPTAKSGPNQHLEDIRMRDICILVDEATKTYYAISSGRAQANDGFRNSIVRAYISKDLINWEGPHTIFQTPSALWGDVNIVGIWAPEMHFYTGKYYLFQTFDTDSKFPEQWRDWLPRVKRGSQVLVGDSPLGPFSLDAAGRYDDA